MATYLPRRVFSDEDVTEMFEAAAAIGEAALPPFLPEILADEAQKFLGAHDALRESAELRHALRTPPEDPFNARVRSCDRCGGLTLAPQRFCDDCQS